MIDARPKYYDKYGKPLTLMQWAELFEDFKYKRINFTQLWWGGKVSTVWLGLDHNFSGGQPIIFETMTANIRGRYGFDEARYPGLADARNGHIKMVKKWSSVAFLIVFLYLKLACLVIKGFRRLRRGSAKG